MDSLYVEWLNTELHTQYPDLVRAIGEQQARAEVSGYLGELVTNQVLDTIDAREIEARLYAQD